MAAAFSSLLGPAHPHGLVRLNSKTRDSASSCCSSSSSGMMPLPLRRSSRIRRMKAVMMTATPMTATRESVLLTSRRKESAMVVAAAFDYKKMMEEEEEKRKKKKSVEDPVTAERLDEWIRDSIGEIVRNIRGEAPFLMQLFSKGPSLLRLERGEDLPESWPLITKTWEQDSSCIPDGVILVKQLKDNDDNNNEEEVEESAANESNECSSSGKRWGLLVQGRGMDCAAASCYILNTCRVRSAAGFCTHFCLVRAKCFGDSLDKQVNKAWLQGR